MNWESDRLLICVPRETPTDLATVLAYAPLSFSTGGLLLTTDHPNDPYGKLLNQYAVGSSELISFYRGAATIGSDGRVSVELPEGAVVGEVSDGAVVEGSQVRLQTDLARDVELRVGYTLPDTKTAPE